MQAAQSEKAYVTGALVVESAVHGRIRVPLSPGTIAIGRAISSDLVLGDSSVGGTHFRLHVGSTLSLEAVDQPLVFTGARVIAPGQTSVVEQATGFSAGEVSMHLDIVCPPVNRPNPAWQRIAASAVLLAFAGSAAYAFAGRAPLPGTAIAPLVEVPRQEAASLLDLAALQARLDQQHLGSVAIEALPDGSYRATGKVAPQEAAAWHDATRWFDEGSAGRVVLIDRVTIAVATPPLAIQSAWVGATPYVIDGAGQKLFVGAVVADGWTIEGIEAGRVTVKRQGQRLAVTF